MPPSIFPVLSLDPGQVHWEDYLDTLTPVEEHEGVYFKRDDYFAPLGYGGINGSKLRQCIYLINQARNLGAAGILSAASVRSPQLSMSTAVAKPYGLPAVQIIGGKP